MLPLALGADMAGKAAEAASGGPATSGATFRDLTGPQMGSRPWSTQDKLIAAVAAVVVVALVAIALTRRKG